MVKIATIESITEVIDRKHDWLHLLFTDKYTVSRAGLLENSPMCQNVKTFSRDTPSKQFTR